MLNVVEKLNTRRSGKRMYCIYVVAVFELDYKKENIKFAGFQNIIFFTKSLLVFKTLKPSISFCLSIKRNKELWFSFVYYTLKSANLLNLQ